MFTFKNYLQTILLEGGQATSKWNTERATKEDIEAALSFIAEHTSISLNYLKNALLGSTELTFIGKKADSGDIDIAVGNQDGEMKSIHKDMMKAVNNEGVMNQGTKVGSYAVPVSDKKKVQVDLMFVENLDWAKFSFFSSEGFKSKYKGAVRNMLLMAVAKEKLVPGEDVVVTDENGEVIARASRSWKLDTGLERLFKIAPAKKSGTGRVKNLVKVSPEELQAELEKIDPKYKKVKFSKNADIINNPDDVAEHLFGPGVKAKDIMTVEQVLKLIPKKFKEDEIQRIMNEARETLKKTGLDVPKDLA